MNEINLFGKMQKYPQIEKKFVERILKTKIKKVIKEDYKFLCDNNNEKYTENRFESFYNEQIDYLIKIYNKSKNMEEFLLSYSYKGKNNM